MPAAVALEDAVQDTAYAMPDWSTLTAIAAPEEKPKHREYLGPGLRFAAGFLLAAAFCLLVLSVADTWWRFRAQLAIPLNDGGVINAFGGVALTYRQYCPRFSNATMNSGQPIIAPLTCFAVQLDLSQPPSVQPAYNTQYSRGVLACVAISMLTCLLALFLLVTAPSEAERKAGVAARAALATGTPAERQARGLAVTFTVDEDGGTQLRAAAPSCLLRTLRCVAGCQHRAVACLPLHALLPLLLAPPFTATIALSGLWVDGMASVPPETLIGALSNISCAADSPLCNEYLTLPGPGLVGAMVGCVAMLMACLLSILAWAFPTCCPRLYESVGDGGKDGSGSGSAAGGRHAGLGSSPYDDDDDDDEDDMLIRVTPLKAVMKSINVVKAASGHADAATGAAAVVGACGAVGAEGAAAGEGASGVVLVPDAAAAAASATAAARSLVTGAASVVSAAQRGTVAGSVAGPAVAAGSRVPSRESSRSFLPLVLGRLGELAAVAAGAAAAGGAGAAVAPGASSTSADPSAVVAAAAAAAQSGASGPGSAASLEHPALRVHAGLVALLRLGSLATLALYAASYSVQWWSFTFADADEGVYWGGGVGVNYLQVNYEPQDERKWYSLSVALRFAVAPLVSLAAPTILAALCVTLAAAAAVCAFAVLLPLDNFFMRLLLWSPCQQCRCARGTVCGRATAQLRAQLGLREATAASALFAPFGSVAIFPAEAGMGGMGGLGIDGLGLGIAGASSGLGSSGSGSGGADVSMETIHGGSAAAADSLLGGPGAGLGVGGRFGGSSAATQSLLGPGPADGVHALLAGAASSSAPARPGFAGDDTSVGAADVASAAAASSLPASAAARDHEVGTAAPAGTVGPSGLGFHPYDDGAAAAAATLVLLHSCRAVDRLAAGTCFAHAAGGWALLASAIFLAAAGTFDWDGFLFTYLDPMHLPDVVYQYQLGPGPIMLLFAAALALCVGGVLIYLWHKRYRTLTLLLRAAIVRREDILA